MKKTIDVSGTGSLTWFHEQRITTMVITGILLNYLKEGSFFLAWFDY